MPEQRNDSSAAKRPDCPTVQHWQNLVPCMCSVTADKNGVRLDRSACSLHGKAAKS